MSEPRHVVGLSGSMGEALPKGDSEPSDPRPAAKPSVPMRLRFNERRVCLTTCPAIYTSPSQTGWRRAIGCGWAGLCTVWLDAKPCSRCHILRPSRLKRRSPQGLSRSLGDARSTFVANG
jgi:hypothetical protein